MEKIFIIIGIILGITANIICISYGLYLWGGEGLAFGLAVWTAFKLWLNIILAALATIAFGIMFEY